MSVTMSSVVRQEILQLKQLPPLSVTANRLLMASANPDIDVDELAEIIGCDPSLSARILGIANSAYFARGQPIFTVRDAIIRVLGLNMVQSLALSIAICGTFSTNHCKRFNLADYWCTSLGCAALSRMLASKLNKAQPVEPDALYFCGLLHNLGSLVLAFVFPAGFSEVLAEYKRGGTEDVLILEQEYLGLTRFEAGELIAQRWHLPEFVIHLLGSLGRKDYCGEYLQQMVIVRHASQWMQHYLLGEKKPLCEEVALLELPGLNALTLDIIEQRMLEQCRIFRAQSLALV